MATEKFSQFTAASTPALTDIVVGLQGGNNAQYTVGQIGGAVGVIGAPVPGDALANAGTAPVAAHSMARKLFAAYSGALFQVRRTSDNATLDIGTLSDGWADVSSLTTFLGASAGTVTQIYDQTG